MKEYEGQSLKGAALLIFYSIGIYKFLAATPTFLKQFLDEVGVALISSKMF